MSAVSPSPPALGHSPLLAPSDFSAPGYLNYSQLLSASNKKPNSNWFIPKKESVQPLTKIQLEAWPGSGASMLSNIVTLSGAGFFCIGGKIAPGSSKCKFHQPRSSLKTSSFSQKSRDWLQLVQVVSHSYTKLITVSLIGQTWVTSPLLN